MPEENTPTVTPVTAPANGPTVESLQADVDKWKAMSRTNEKRYEDASAERDALKAAGLSDSDKALEAAKTEARNAAFSEYGSKLAEAELRAKAATEGVTLPDSQFINIGQFLGADGTVNTELIGTFVSSLPQPATTPTYAQGIGLGRQGSGAVGQLSQTDLSNMSAKEINEARKAGKLDLLLRGTS
ncbi:hypothetical protein [Streptomyces sp. H39-S7]|uniref:hypothetical protein n=1 Tax=Streptomyces sp. H39-S7 TaxID=3004357 RepID=UPI0022B0006F|nr:hypothetical protein [Streptomyces sp. H39-S7]MCZ4119030.1 hypothetical protein [Streptomyces sp. H39-S7]